jgi:hypothetical protein
MKYMERRVQLAYTADQMHAHAAAVSAPLLSALTKIDAIRNSIIGAQKVNWSEHVYPLVAALDEAGFPGQPYEQARENVGTLLEQINKAEQDNARLREALKSADAAFESAEIFLPNNCPQEFAFYAGWEDVRAALKGASHE